MYRRMVSAFALALVALIGAACSSGEPEKAAPAANAVTIKGFLFKPASLSVKAGTAVTWTNRDDIAHTITSGSPGEPAGVFDSGDETLGKTFTHTFGTAGTFAYFCKNHNSMTAQITVT
jgi:plastocyanin